MLATLIAASLTTSFGVSQMDGRWMFKASSGPFWSLATCCTGPGTTWDEYNPKNPSYAAHKLFPNSKAWVEHTLDTLHANGFNSIGGWSDTSLFQKYGEKKRLPYFEVLHLGAYDKAPWRDMFSKEHVQIIEKAAKDQIEKIKDDPYLVGYFSDNELGWWREALFVTYLGMESKEPGRKKFVDFVAKHYKNSWSAFQKDWTTKHSRFESIDGDIKLKSGGNGMSVVKNWQTFLTDHYYRQMRATIRKYDPNRLIMGDRYCQFYYPNVVESSTKHIDVVSTNYGADWNSGENTEYFLSALHQITKKPVLITEFYMAAMENRSGNMNSSGGFPVVQTQLERENSVRKYLADLGRRPYVLGAHWFQYWDEPTHGRGDGENYNMGLVDIHGKPYDGMMKVFKEFKPSTPWVPEYKHTLPAPGQDSEKGLKHWPKAEALIKPGPEAPFGDLYVFATKDHLTIGLASMGFTDEALYPDKKIPEGDRTQFSIKLNGQHHWVRFGGKDRPCTTDSASKVAYWRDGVRSELVIQVPRPAGGNLKIDASLVTHGRADRMTWNDSRTLP